MSIQLEPVRHGNAGDKEGRWAQQVTKRRQGPGARARQRSGDYPARHSGRVAEAAAGPPRHEAGRCPDSRQACAGVQRGQPRVVRRRRGFERCPVVCAAARRLGRPRRRRTGRSQQPGRTGRQRDPDPCGATRPVRFCGAGSPRGCSQDRLRVDKSPTPPTGRSAASHEPWGRFGS